MTVYSFNLALGWASSGVEYAQVYRAECFREIGQEAKFIFTEFFNDVNFQHFAENIGFENEEAIWLYQALTDMPTAPTSFSLTDLEETFSHKIARKEELINKIRYFFEGIDQFVTAYLTKSGTVFTAEYVTQGALIRKDYYTDRKYFSEFFSPVDNQAKMYARCFYQLDGSVAYEELIQDNESIFRIDNQVLFGRNELLKYYLQSLNLTKKDVVLIDRSSKIGSTILKYAKPAKIGCVIHAEHYNENSTNENHVLWNNFYEYMFEKTDLVDFYLASTELQAKTLQKQYKKYKGISPKIYAIPVGNLKQLHHPSTSRKSFSLMTASRLAAEKNIDQLILAVIAAKQELPELTFDIYGTGGKREQLQALIQTNQAQDYIHLKGHHQLDEIYQQYETYLTASGSEGFGLTLMEAVGSGLYMIGYDVPYGNPTFIESGKNGYLLPLLRDYDKDVASIAKAIVSLYQSKKIQTSGHQVSYQIAEEFTLSQVAEKWKKVLGRVTRR